MVADARYADVEIAATTYMKSDNTRPMAAPTRRQECAVIRHIYTEFVALFRGAWEGNMRRI
jgi:hypothetical protein